MCRGRLTILVVIALCGVLSMAPTVTKAPNGGGTYTDWGEPYTIYSANDGDATVGYGTAGAYQTVNVEDLPSDAQFVDSVVLHVVYRLTGGSNVGIDYFLYDAALGNSTDAWFTAVPNGSYTDASVTLLTGPTGVSWTPAIFNATEFGMLCQDDPSGEEDMMVTQIYVVVTYRAPAGVFVITIEPGD